MRTAPLINVPPREAVTATACPSCGIALDSEYFDESSVVAPPRPGETIVLAAFQLPAQYCGVLSHFSQFTDVHAASPGRILTPGLEWVLRANGRPLFPYTRLGHILNPWGWSCCPVTLRLDEDTRVELTVRNTDAQAHPDGVRLVGGRLLGRYWYNTSYGGAVRRGRSG